MGASAGQAITRSILSSLSASDIVFLIPDLLSSGSTGHGYWVPFGAPAPATPQTLNMGLHGM